MKKLVMGMALVSLLMPVGAWAKIGGGDIRFRLQRADDVIYSHDVHVGSKGLKCKDCHYKIYTTVEGHRKYTMAEMENGASCGACHNGTAAFTVKDYCNKCHTK
jgi:c(7)-type cytochrome triheme protein